MGLAGRFVPIPSPLDEAALARELLETGGSSLDPKTYTRILAERKALALAESLLLDQDDGAVETSSSSSSMVTLVLGSDTIVALEDGRILEKPVDEIDATRMLQELEGKRHCVHTGVALIQVSLATTTSTMGATKNSGTTAPIDAIAGTAAAAAATALLSPPRVIASFTDTATVQFATLTPTDIATYVATGEPMDKAGSYGIQGIGGQMVTCVEGDFFTVSSNVYMYVSVVVGVVGAPGFIPRVGYDWLTVVVVLAVIWRLVVAGHGFTNASNESSFGGRDRRHCISFATANRWD